VDGTVTGCPNCSQLKEFYFHVSSEPETAILCSCMEKQGLIQVWYLPQTVGVSLTVTINTKREKG
jgi:hypothetical protein